ncbi:MAG: type IV secretory system conjugative DNA transfer family protein, partial [Chloroflexota bacterium]
REQVGTENRTERARMRIFVDEFQSLPTVDYPDFLATLAKYGANFFLATQSLGIVKELDPKLFHSLLANVSTLFAFQCNYADAEVLCGEMGNTLRPEELVSLPDHACYLSLTAGGVQLPPVFVKTLPPDIESDGAERAQQIAQQSRERDGRPIDAVLQAQVQTWSTKAQLPSKEQAAQAGPYRTAANDLKMQSNRDASYVVA